MSTTEPPRDRNFVQSLERGLAVIRALSVPAPGLTLADVAREAGLTRTSARRFLLTLEEVGYVRSVDRRFSLTPRVLELGYSFLSSLTLPEIAQPHLRELVERVHESSSAGLWVQLDMNVRPALQVWTRTTVIGRTSHVCFERAAEVTATHPRGMAASRPPSNRLGGPPFLSPRASWQRAHETRLARTPGPAQVASNQ